MGLESIESSRMYVFNLERILVETVWRHIWFKTTLFFHMSDPTRLSYIALDVSKYIWANYEDQLRQSGDLFYTWQYDYRWQATELRKKGILKDSDKRGYWELV